jgi:hypothetical protein
VIVDSHPAQLVAADGRRPFIAWPRHQSLSQRRRTFPSRWQSAMLGPKYTEQAVAEAGPLLKSLNAEIVSP